MFEGRKDLSAYAGITRDRLRTAADNASIRVNCVIAGTQKGGTTALASYLYEHPQLCIPGTKEMHFFDAEENFAGASVDFDYYHSAFAPGPSARILCDATPIYMYWDPVPQRIWKYNPGMKWIFVLRDPATRAFSHWNMQRIKDRDPLPFFEALSSEPARCRTVLPLQHPWWSYIDRGFYAQQLRRVMRFFPVSQMLVLKSEDVHRAPQQALDRVARFLGIEPFAAVEARDVYAIPYATTMEARARRLLQQTFEFDVRDLERLLGWDCGGWLEA